MGEVKQRKLNGQTPYQTVHPTICTLKQIEDREKRIEHFFEQLSPTQFAGRYAPEADREEIIDYFKKEQTSLVATDTHGEITAVLEHSYARPDWILINIVANRGCGDHLMRHFRKLQAPHVKIGGLLSKPFNVATTRYFMRHCDFLGVDLFTTFLKERLQLRLGQSVPFVPFFIRGENDLNKRIDDLYRGLYPNPNKNWCREKILTAICFTLNTYIVLLPNFVREQNLPLTTLQVQQIQYELLTVTIDESKRWKVPEGYMAHMLRKMTELQQEAAPPSV